MNVSQSAKDDPDDEMNSFLQLVMRYQDGTLSADETKVFEAELLKDSEKQILFSELQMQSAVIHDSLRQQAYDLPEVKKAKSIGQSKRQIFVLLVLGGLVASVVFVAGLAWRSPSIEDSGPVPSVVRLTSQDNVKFTGMSRATFFGESAPKVPSAISLHREYVLTGGLVELSFPDGATAIVESPAIFTVVASDALAIDTGRCSVHAPDGAEGFRLETPVSRVVDRGTRFTVNVSENSETEVQVVEGAADVYGKPEVEYYPSAPASKKERAKPPEPLSLQVRLEDRQARRFTNAEQKTGTPIEFSVGRYRNRLPDRVVDYEAQTTEDGSLTELMSVSVQRGGRLQTFRTSSLIPCELTAFRTNAAADNNGHLVGKKELPDLRRGLLSDVYLNTGVINPGGEVLPLQAAETVDRTTVNTPGMSVHFSSPVLNQPGPDVVFFELQTLTNPPEGDAFHVSPLLPFSAGRRTLTVREYDIQLTSPLAHQLAGFYLYRPSVPIGSLSELQEVKCDRSPMRLRFRALAVGIDLSQLGFEDGETVSNLFFQDAADNNDRVDPVFIAGLPPSGIDNFATNN